MGGPSPAKLADALRALARRATIAALGVGCTLTPQGLAQADALAVVPTLIQSALGAPG
jgi:hypothetical protein